MPDINDRKDSLTQQVQALTQVLSSLNDLLLDTSDPDEADSIRLQIARTRETLFAKQAQLDALNAVSVIPPVSDAEKAAVMGALADLDRFVVADQEAHAALSFLTQIAGRIAQA